MASEALTPRDVLLPFLGAGAGYVIGVLQTAAANMRERRKALNTVLYALLQMRREARISNPRAVILPQISDLILRRFGPDAVARFVQMGVPAVIYDALQATAGDRLSALTTQYNEAVRALIPVDPLLAYSLTGDRLIRLDSFVKNYYEHVRQCVFRRS